jgi:Ca2+/H+ antiporter
VVYGSYLAFQLGTHHDLFSGGDEETGTPALTLTAAILWLSGITVLVAFLSEFLTGSIEEVRGSRSRHHAPCPVQCWYWYWRIVLVGAMNTR